MHLCLVCAVLRIAFTKKAVELKEGESVPLVGVTAVNPFSVEVEVGVQCLELVGTGARPGRSGGMWFCVAWYGVGRCSTVWCGAVHCGERCSLFQSQELSGVPLLLQLLETRISRFPGMQPSGLCVLMKTLLFCPR